MTEREPPEVGETRRTVILYPNKEDSRDPVAQISGETVFIRFPDDVDYQPDMGDEVEVKIADINKGHYIGAAVAWEDEDAKT